MKKNIKTFEGKKTFDISNIKFQEENGVVKFKGYANTKNKEDRYGDIPTVFTPLRNFVYDLTEYKKNPILLIDHNNNIGYLAGSITKIFEDVNGLYIEGEFSKSDYPLVRHAATIYAEGHAKTVSIGGQWFYEDTANPQHLTLAKIFEISLVCIPADPDAIITAQEEEEKAAPDNIGEKAINALNSKVESALVEQKLSQINDKFEVKSNPVKQG